MKQSELNAYSIIGTRYGQLTLVVWSILILSNCADVTFTQKQDENPQDTDPEYELLEKAVTVRDSRVDILFVVDNSGSMQQEHQNMSARVANFVEKLDRLDWQMAMTTTDPRSAVTNGDGRLLTFKSGKTILRSTDPVADSQVDLSATIQMPTNGSGEEQGILTTFRMLERAIGGEEPHRTFLRDGAHLAVVLISDEDESADGDRNKPDSLINYVKKTWNNLKTLQYHSIITVPNDQACLAPRGTGYTYGQRYAEISTKTGGIVGSVCEADYGAQLAKIGDGVRSLVTSIELDCEPQDVDKDGQADLEVTLQGGGIVPGFTIQDKKLVFADPLPIGQHTVTYACLKNR